MKTKLNWKLIAGIAGLSLAFTSLAASDLELDQLKKQIQELDQKVRILEREREIDQDNAAAVAKTVPKIIIGGSGASFSCSHTTFGGFTGKAAPGTVPAQAENVLFSRVQLGF